MNNAVYNYYVRKHFADNAILKKEPDKKRQNYREASIKVGMNMPKLNPDQAVSGNLKWKKACKRIADDICKILISLSNGEQPTAGELLGDPRKMLSLKQIATNPDQVIEALESVDLGSKHNIEKADKVLLSIVKKFFENLGKVSQSSVEKKAASLDSWFQPILPHLWELAFWKNRRVKNPNDFQLKRDIEKYKEKASAQRTMDSLRLKQIVAAIESKSSPNIQLAFDESTFD